MVSCLLEIFAHLAEDGGFRLAYAAYRVAVLLLLLFCCDIHFDGVVRHKYYINILFEVTFLGGEFSK